MKKDKKYNMKKTILTALVLALLLTAGCGAAPAAQPEATNTQPAATAQTAAEPPETGAVQTPAQGGVALSRAKIGDTLADFDITLLDGGSAKLSDYRGKAVILNFWATWCSYCVEEMPAFQQLKKTYGDDLVVLAIDADAAEQTDEKDFVASSGYDFVFGVDTDGLSSFLAGIPYSVVVGPDGVVVYTQSGSEGDNTFDLFSGYISTALGK